jgi:hypothetical protein
MSIHAECPVRTARHAFATADAALLEINHFRLFKLAFGVMTPSAAERAAFQKDGCANPRSVVDGESHDIKNEARWRVFDRSSRRNTVGWRYGRHEAFQPLYIVYTELIGFSDMRHAQRGEIKADTLAICRGEVIDESALSTERDCQGEFIPP